MVHQHSGHFFAPVALGWVWHARWLLIHPTSPRAAAWWGGLGSCGAYLTAFLVIWHHLQCHEPHCPRLVIHHHTHCKKHRDREAV